MLDEWTIEALEPLVGERFAVAEPGVELRLVEAKRLARVLEGGREPFSLTFEGPLERPLGQAAHPLRHERLGLEEVFLVPVGREGEALLYEAVFA